MKKPQFPDGHFYSPVVDIAAVETAGDRIWLESPQILGIEMNHQRHLEIIEKVLGGFIAAYHYPAHPHVATDFYECNSQFNCLDSRLLFCFLRSRKPKCMIEIGSGFSSLLSADVNHRFLNSAMDFHCIEPYPRDFLLEKIPGLTELHRSFVQDIPLDLFEKLAPNDILFIDSSHVSKTGSDVNYLYFEVLPRLPKGVLIHIHDIFLPYEYPKNWVLQEGRSWNEQYLLQALLMHSNAFKVAFGSQYSVRNCRAEVARALNISTESGILHGSSFWIEASASPAPTTTSRSSSSRTPSCSSNSGV